jgi:hypothetical protein
MNLNKTNNPKIVISNSINSSSSILINRKNSQHYKTLMNELEVIDSREMGMQSDHSYLQDFSIKSKN